jgi:RimJ/RimL family protein N-acetyltransferase
VTTVGERLIRTATPEDARAIAEVHVASWRSAYRGLLPDAYLDRLSVDEREAQRREHLDDSGSGWGTLVAEEDGRVIGFATFGPSRDEDAPPGTGEVPAIYLDPSAVGTGVGRELFAETVSGLRSAGFTRATLWVLEANERARRFYEKAGWTRDGATSDHDFDCANEPMVRYAAELSGAASAPAASSS